MKKIVRHCTVSPDEPNIVPPSMLLPLVEWTKTARNNEGKATLTFAVGAAETLWLSAEQIARVRGFLEGIDLDFYVPHPREENLFSPSCK